ncbi:MAG: hypothetical protein HUU56_14265 [Bdellovibrionaceae bacterium]|nr:hypothetical protein [Pseudobdellovibrionaceae bacterium]
MIWEETIQLKFCLLNAENLFLLFDKTPSPDDLKLDEVQWQKLSNSIYPNKTLSKCKELAAIFKELQLDIIMLCEVGGIESLKNFNDLFLNQEYSVALIEGNSDRNIDVGFLIKKNSTFYFDLTTNKNRSINFLYHHERHLKTPPENKLSRDCVELKLFKKDINKPFLNILLTHLKSRLDPEKKDPNGFERRSAELKTVLEIQQELQGKYPEVPLILAGDFNGNASRHSTEEEFKDIYVKTSLEDVLELSQTPIDKRATFYQVKTSGRTDGKQIDYCFLTSSTVKYLDPTSANVYRYKDNYGFEKDIPTSLDKKFELPSDHYPIVFSLSNLPTKV